ncbi:hypothetical protein H7H37_22345, partial [Mycolicibacterium insubricum]|nr:hypothetical protein [Mycolicibacterium insubricum]
MAMISARVSATGATRCPGSPAAVSAGRNSAAGRGAIAVAGGLALMAAFQGLLLPYLRRQEANSHLGRDSYVGLLG